MSWNEVKSDNELIWTPTAPGDSIEGALVSKGEKNNKTNTTIYRLRIKKGVRIITGSDLLDDRMSKIEVGEVIRIEYVGKQITDSDKEVRVFKVFKFNNDFKQLKDRIDSAFGQN